MLVGALREWTAGANRRRRVSPANAPARRRVAGMSQADSLAGDDRVQPCEAVEQLQSDIQRRQDEKRVLDAQW